MLWFLLSCTADKVELEDVLSLTEALSDSEVRAGEIYEPSALFAGTSSEGQIGDFKLYNNKVQFVIQSIRPSAYYMQQGGGILDADVIRMDGEQGRDAIDEHSPMAGFGRILEPSSIEVLEDGASGTATIRVLGSGVAFELLEGAVENTALVPDKMMTFQVDYQLLPNSSLLKVETTIEWLDEPFAFQPASIILMGREVIDWWNPGEGYFGDSNNQWYGAIGRQNEVAVGLFPSEDSFASSVIQPLLADATPAMSGFDSLVEFEQGTTHTFTHYVGVGMDFATLTDDWYETRSVATEIVSGTVTSTEGPVEGARVHIFDGEETLTLAVSDENGEWSANVPTTASVQYQVSGRGHAEIYDVPEGAGWHGLYAEGSVTDSTLLSLQDGAPSRRFAEGFGVGELNTDVLTAPGYIDVVIADGGPGVVLVDGVDEDVVLGTDQVPGRPSGHRAMGYVRDGDLALPLEPGEYRVIVHRGPECEYSEGLVTIVSGQRVAVDVELDCVELPQHVYSLDPHSHSSPSGDARIATVERMLTHAGHGVDFHISTEHDHIADFSSVVESLELTDHLQTIIGAEVSPTLRGHHNVYPLTPNDTAVNKGALSWWSAWSTTEVLYEQMRSLLSSDGVVQVNHPLGTSGLFDAAGYDRTQGTISKPNYWSDDFDAMELINDGSFQSYLPYYFDLVSRGYSISPVSVSDSHSHTGGVGLNRTYVASDNDSVSAVMTALKEGRVVATMGPYIHLTIDNEFAPGAVFTGGQSLQTEVFHPSWMDIDLIELYENGQIVDSVEYNGEAVVFDINPSEDAHYTVAASGTFPMTPIYSSSPWGMSAAIFIDVDGNGWDAPLDALE